MGEEFYSVLDELADGAAALLEQDVVWVTESGDPLLPDELVWERGPTGVLEPFYYEDSFEDEDEDEDADA